MDITIEPTPHGAGSGGTARSLTPAIYYDNETIRTGASFSLTAYHDLCRKGIEKVSPVQREQQAKVALDDIRTLQRRLQAINKLARSRRWSLPALIPLLLPPIVRSVSWLCRLSGSMIALTGSGTDVHLSRSFSPSDPNGTVATPGSLAGSIQNRTKSAWAGIVGFFTEGQPNTTTSTTDQCQRSWAGALSSPWQTPPQGSSPQEIMYDLHLSRFRHIWAMLGSGQFAMLSVGILASLFTVHNELLLFLAERMSYRLQDLSFKLEKREDLTENDVSIPTNWSWAILLRPGYSFA